MEKKELIKRLEIDGLKVSKPVYSYSGGSYFKTYYILDTKKLSVYNRYKTLPDYQNCCGFIFYERGKFENFFVGFMNGKTGKTNFNTDFTVDEFIKICKLNYSNDKEFDIEQKRKESEKLDLAIRLYLNS